MIDFIEGAPFDTQKRYLVIRYRFKGLSHLVVSGNNFVQLPHCPHKRTKPLKIIHTKTHNRMKYIWFDNRKISKSELKSRKYKVHEYVQIPFK